MADDVVVVVGMVVFILGASGTGSAHTTSLACTMRVRLLAHTTSLATRGRLEPRLRLKVRLGTVNGVWLNIVVWAY